MGQTGETEATTANQTRGGTVAKREAGQLYTVAKAVLRPCFWFAWRIEAQGLDNVPTDGPAILCPNHISFIDSMFVPAVLDRRVTYVGKAEYLDSWKTRRLMPALGMIPIDRKGGNAAQAALDAAARVLERGELFGIYPEGTRSRDGRLHKGHTGAARLALRTGAPIIPVGIIGTREIQPADAVMPRLFREASVRFAPPIHVDRYRDRASDKLILRQITDEVMYEIRNLTGQEYVDAYATKKPESIPRETAVVQSGEGAAAHRNGDSNGNGSGNGERRRSSADVLAGARTA
jgi:1-acyl-sn-glycerol-3-phosphate acyltransferase